MYKKFLLFIALLCSSMQYAFDAKPLLEIKPSYFFFSSSPMNTIYNHGGFEVQLSTSVPIGDACDLYGSVGYRRASGDGLMNQLQADEPTALTVLPIDIGIKPIFNCTERCSYFFAVGPRVFYFSQNNSSQYISNMVDGGGIGFFVNTGFDILFAEKFLLGIFGEYSYENVSISPKLPNVYSNGTVQIGGFSFGISLGYAF